jgi:glycerophosphoryl diester phosphodiesterase
MDEYGKQHGLDALHPRVSCLAYTPDLVKKAQAKGLKVHAWTANTEEEMRFCAGLGVDGIISNYPDKLGAVLREGGGEG